MSTLITYYKILHSERSPLMAISDHTNDSSRVLAVYLLDKLHLNNMSKEFKYVRIYMNRIYICI